MTRIKVGDPLAVGPDVGSVSPHAQLEQRLSYMKIGKAEGAALAEEGERVIRHTGSGAVG